MAMASLELNTEQQFSGVIVPLVTPLFPDQSLDLTSLERLLGFHMASNVDGFWLNGTSGEFYAMCFQEREEVIRAAKNCVEGRARIIANVGHTSTRLVIDHAARILDLGVDALAVVPPYYIPHSQQELKDHFRSISQELDQALFLYHVPSMCKQSLTYDNILELAAEGVLAGIKDSAGNIESFAELVRRTTERKLQFCCLNGNSAFLGDGYLAGAHGFAGAIANMIPAHCKLTYEAAQRADVNEVHSSQNAVTELFRVLKSYSGRASFTWLNKWVLRELGVIARDTVFQPCDRLDSNGELYLRTHLMPLVKEVTPVVEITT